jgi:hypothetical protein
VDFFLWPPLKNSIYQKPVHDLRLKLRKSEKVNEINNDPGRAHLCLEQHGEHFHLLLQLLNKINVFFLKIHVFFDNNSSLFDEFVSKLDLFWHAWAILKRE